MHHQRHTPYRPVRRKILRTALGAAALCGAIALAPRAGAQLVDPALATQIEELPNGAIVLTLPDPSTPVVSLQIWVRAGSRDEARYTGLAHLFEHMMFRGTDRLAPEAHSRLLQARGGVINAYTSRDVTVYFEDLPADALPLAIALEAERFGRLLITEETLASERKVVLDERRQRTEDSPQGRAYEALLALTFRAHPYRHPVIGWRSDIELASVTACQDFFRHYYAPNNLVIVIAGAFDREDALRQIRASFGPLAREPVIPRNPTREPPQRGERREIVYFDLRAPVLATAWPAPPTGHPDAEALDVASYLLASGRASRLYRRLVYQGEGALTTAAHYQEYFAAGIFLTFTTVRPGGEVVDVEQQLLEEVGRLRRELVSASELTKAQRQLEVLLLSDLDTAHGLASRIASDYVALGRIRPLAERLAAYRAVTAEDVRRVARTYLRDDRLNVVRVLPPPDATGDTPEPQP